MDDVICHTKEGKDFGAYSLSFEKQHVARIGLR